MTTNKILYSLLFIRKFEEALLDLFQKGKLNGTTHTCIGQEEIPVAIMPLLIKEDYIEKCVNFINQKNPLCFQSDLLWFSNNQILRQTNHRYSNLQNFKQQLLTRCCVNTPTVFYKKDLLEKFNLKTKFLI